jgi:glycosyltransferase involved in cell wall biosynthesis
LLLPAARKLPWVIHWHSDVIGDKPKLAIRLLYPVYQLFERWLLKKAAAIVCTSPTYLASSKPLQPFKHKCVVIPLGLAALADTNATLPVDKTEAEITLRLLVVGRLAYYKGHKYLFEALALLPAGRKVEVVLVGSGELRRQLEQQVQQLKLRQVTFVGSVSDTELKRWYAWCDCLCLPSIERTEAFGMVIIEAARQGKPAIVTGVPGSGMAWVVQHNKTGWVVPPADSQALAMQLRQLIHHPELATQAGYNACQRFKSTFSIKQVALKLVQLYHQLVPNTK